MFTVLVGVPRLSGWLVWRQDRWNQTGWYPARCWMWSFWLPCTENPRMFDRQGIGEPLAASQPVNSWLDRFLLVILHLMLTLTVRVVVVAVWDKDSLSCCSGCISPFLDHTWTGETGCERTSTPESDKLVESVFCVLVTCSLWSSWRVFRFLC